MKVAAVSKSAKVGVKKENQAEIRLVKDKGVAGDAHAGLEDKRQVSLLALESISLMNEKKAGAGLDLVPGDFAENITTEGLELHTMPVGTFLRLGAEAVLEISQIGKSCHRGCAIKQATGDCIMPTQGVFGRVVVEGVVRPGDPIEILLSRPHQVKNYVPEA